MLFWGLGFRDISKKALACFVADMVPMLQDQKP